MDVLFSLLFSLTLKLSSSQQSYLTYTASKDKAYNGQTLKCIDNIDCVLNCYAAKSCSYARIIGPANATLTINCDSRMTQPNTRIGHSCYLAKFFAQKSTKLYINVANGHEELRGTYIWTPTIYQPSSVVNTYIKCGIIGPNIVNISYTTTRHSCTLQNKIYSLNGWQSVNWTYIGNASWYKGISGAYGNRLFCGTNYLTECCLASCNYDRSFQTTKPSTSPTSPMPSLTASDSVSDTDEATDDRVSIGLLVLFAFYIQAFLILFFLFVFVRDVVERITANLS